MNTSYGPIQDTGKCKGKARDDAFEAAFAQFTSGSRTGVSSARIEEVTDEAQNAATVLNSVSAEQGET